jgi:GT2 family glycosyltransferase
MRTIVINATLFPRALFDELSFDERLRYGYEEVDIASRAVAAGLAVVPCPEARNDHRPSPLAREDHDDLVTPSRLYATFKRYRWTERRRARAAAFAVLAPAHLVGSAAKTRDPAAVISAARSLRLAAGHVAAHRRALRSAGAN